MQNNRKIYLVATTIGDGNFLDNYANEIKNENLMNQVYIIVVPDLKTPKELYKKVFKIKKNGIKIQCPTVEEQNSYLEKLGKISKIIPFNSDNRRNIGYLMAYHQHCDVLISIDDDNYPYKDSDFFKEHMKALSTNRNLSIKSSSGWYNICSELTHNQLQIFPRGYPYFARTAKNTIRKIQNEQKVAINAGLWLNDPDVDAMTWLSCPPHVSKFSGNSYTLANNTWSPINTQNTSLIGNAIPAYYFVRMGYPIEGSVIDRYGDIFSGFFALKCVKHLGMTVRFGSPVVNHIRNSHNYMKDVVAEMMCIQLLEHLLPELERIKLNGTNFIDTYESLSFALDEIAEKVEICKKEKDYSYFLHETAKNMRVWIKTIKYLSD
jgi:hypothetical protein